MLRAVRHLSSNTLLSINIAINGIDAMMTRHPTTLSTRSQNHHEAYTRRKVMDWSDSERGRGDRVWTPPSKCPSSLSHIYLSTHRPTVPNTTASLHVVGGCPHLSLTPTLNTIPGAGDL